MTDLVTERLVLHPISVDEAERMVAGEPAADAAWESGFPTEDDVSVAKRLLERCATTGDPQPFGPYVIRRRSDHRVIGGVDFHTPPDEHGHVTIGYGVVPRPRAGATPPKLSAPCCRSPAPTASPR